MIQPEHLDAFMHDMSLPLAWDARLGYQELGRGMLVVGWSDKRSGLFAARYVAIEEAISLGFSAEVVDAIREYDVESEAVVFVECGQAFRLLRIALEQGSNASTRLN